MTLQGLHDKLLAWATAEPRKAYLLDAKREHFERYGEPHEEDRSYEVRLNAMLDYYLYDYRPDGGGTTIQRFVDADGGSLSPEEAAALRALCASVHGLFEVRRIRDARVRLRDLFLGKDHDVTERRQVAGLEKGDLLEARLLPFGSELFFSGAFVYHPREARKAILAEVKRIRKGTPRGAAPDLAPFLAQLARMAMKLERYRNVRLESIYDFTPDARTMTPRPPTRG